MLFLVEARLLLLQAHFGDTLTQWLELLLARVTRFIRFPERGPRRLGIRIRDITVPRDRITSYNVCYTKLLRGIRDASKKKLSPSLPSSVTDDVSSLLPTLAPCAVEVASADAFTSIESLLKT